MYRVHPRLLGFAALVLPALAQAQQAASRPDWTPSVVREVPLLGDGEAPPAPARDKPHWRLNFVREVRFVSNNEAIRDRAANVKGLRLEVDVESHHLYAIDGADTLRSATVATASDGTLTFGGRSWHFQTPRGVRTVLAKERDPVWTPPEWHYAEVALEYGLRLRHLSRGQKVQVSDGTLLLAKGKEVGVIAPGDSQFVPLVLDEHIVFDSTLYIPPAGTKHRTMRGELGHYRLKLGNGIQIHGTPYANTIGASVTHGCVRMSDADIEWLYQNVPVGTKVYLY